MSNPVPMIVTEPVPLEADVDGVLRVGGTRVTLDVVVATFDEGASAEEIAYKYPSLKLADIYATIAFYLQQRAVVEEYLSQRQHHAVHVREQNEARLKSRGIRERLLSRRAQS
jgi:uncharacterized protein (DUF433 family)